MAQQVKTIYAPFNDIRASNFEDVSSITLSWVPDAASQSK
jgi:hypothetical protein